MSSMLMRRDMRILRQANNTRNSRVNRPVAASRYVKSGVAEMAAHRKLGREMPV